MLIASIIDILPVLTLAITTQAIAVALPQNNPTPDPCQVTKYEAIAAAVQNCKQISLNNIAVPATKTIDLTQLKQGAKVTFNGTTTWGYAASNWSFIKISGTDIEITAEANAVLEGGGGRWWNGHGINTGNAQPNFLMEIHAVKGKSSINNINIMNYPTHCFAISDCDGLEVYGNTLDNRAGDQPNAHSKNLAAGHNTDAILVATSSHLTICNNTVYNQDDCVAITSGDSIVVDQMHCYRSHGLSIGSVGDNLSNEVTNVNFTNSEILGGEYGIRIKTKKGATGHVKNIMFDKIHVQGITKYAVDIQQDYLNSSPDGSPTNGVKIEDITITNVEGTCAPKGKHYYVLCGSGSCQNIMMNNVQVAGGAQPSSCNVKTTGDFKCDGKFSY